MLVQLDLTLNEIMLLKGGLVTELKAARKLERSYVPEIKEASRGKQSNCINLYNKLAAAAQVICDAKS